MEAVIHSKGKSMNKHRFLHAGVAASAAAVSLPALSQTAYRSPLMAELMSSLPIVGVDGTLKKRYLSAPGSAHLKSGSLRDVAAVAGYVQAASGKRLVLVAIANHANAQAARPAFEALLDWAVN